MLLLGSHALKIRNPDLLTREPADVDLVMDFDQLQLFLGAHRFPHAVPTGDGKKFVARGRRDAPIHDIEIAWDGSLADQLTDLVINDPKSITARHPSFPDFVVWVPPLDVLYMLKLTHRYLKNSPHFAKTMADIWAMRGAGAQVPEQYEAWYKARIKDTYDYGHPKLNQSKEGFFNGDGVQYVYDHDAIHQVVRLDERGPAYSFFQKDGEQVAVDRAKFEKQPERVRLASVIEEAMVLAIERSLVPHPGALTPRQAFLRALEKVCTSITSGWWREYAWEHYDEAVKAFDRLPFDFWKSFQEEAAAGNVKLYTGSVY